MLRLHAFGTAHLERGGAPLEGGARQRRVLALLALLAVARERGLSRDRVLALLWPESESERARQALTQSLYHARKVLGEDDLFVAGADLRLNPDVITSDVAEFEELLDRGELAEAVARYSGPFLDGFHVSGAAEFERWAEEERERLKGRCARALEQLANASDPSERVEWWRRLAGLEPLNSRITLELMRALADTGDRAGALRQATIHAALLREELDVPPDPAITDLAEAFKTLPPQEVTSPERSGHPRETLPPSVATPAPPVHEATPRELLSDEAVQPAPSPLPRATPRRRRLVIASLGTALIVVIVLGLTYRPWNRDAGLPASAQNVVVAPFRVSGADPALAYLREGLVDLIVNTLPGGEGARAVDPGAVLRAWRRAGFVDRTDVSQLEAMSVARQLEGKRLLIGSVVGTPSRLVVNATLLGLPDGEVRAQASADGPADSLTHIVDHLVARLLAKEAGEWERLSVSMTSSVTALRAYLDGQASYRRGSYREAIRQFRRALELDGSFAVAGLALATAADRVDANDERHAGLAAAWAARAELSTRDHAYLVALAGPSYPEESSPGELLVALERAAAVAPDRADVWHELGERLFLDGAALGLRDWEARATAAFRRAASLDPTFASPLQYLVQLAAATGDTAEVRRRAAEYLRVDSIGELASFVRWRSALARGDSTELRRLRARFSATPGASLRMIALSAQYNATSPGDAERSLDVLLSRAARGMERVDLLLGRYALASNRGRWRSAQDALDRVAQDRNHAHRAWRRIVLEGLLEGGDSAASRDAASRLEAALHADTLRDAEALATVSPVQDQQLNDLCVVGLWRAWTAEPREALLVQDDRPASVATSLPRESACDLLVAAVTAVRSGDRGAASQLAAVDALAPRLPVNSFLREFWSLAVARQFESLGQPARALEVVRQRPNMRAWPHYLAAHLRAEGRLAAALGDSAGAIKAYRRYLALRDASDDAGRDEIARIRLVVTQMAGARTRPR